MSGILQTVMQLAAEGRFTAADWPCATPQTHMGASPDKLGVLLQCAHVNRACICFSGVSFPSQGSPSSLCWASGAVWPCHM